MKNLMKVVLVASLFCSTAFAGDMGAGGFAGEMGTGGKKTSCPEGQTCLAGDMGAGGFAATLEDSANDVLIFIGEYLDIIF